jgi:hypothetical protein
MSPVHKVIVANSGALRRKHKAAGMPKLRAAVHRMIAADRKRGITTLVVHIDRAADMTPFGPRVTSAGDARQVKRAVDAICAALAPHYVLLLGAPDVIPHVQLKNPLSAATDPDRRVESDLPYACDAGYSLDITDFLGPVRVVGRLPDIMGRGDTDYFAGVIDRAASWKSRSRASYKSHFALSAEVWKGSTRASMKKLFGSTKGVHLSPPEGPTWSAGALKPRVHFINCHGDVASPAYFGQAEADENDQPIAHESTRLAGRVAAGTVVAAECCYGAELYDPTGTEMGISQRYLGEGAWGFFGSSTIAYGPADGTEYADLICIEFIQAVRDGASLGRAALQARQRYIEAGGTMAPVDLKTVAQFNLIGDPSIQPVVAKKTARKKAAKPAAKAGEGVAAKAVSWLAARVDRRQVLAVRGRAIARTIATADPGSARVLSVGALSRFRLRLPKGYSLGRRVERFGMRGGDGAPVAALAKRLVKHKTQFFVVSLVRTDGGKALPKAAGRHVEPKRLLVVREVDGAVDSVTVIHRR